MVKTSARIIGTPAAGLSGPASFASSQSAARAGAAAEKALAGMLNRAALEAGTTVMHDLRIPVVLRDGGQPNIDHLWVAGRTVVVLDAKRWRQGFYWTMPMTDRSFIGTERAPHLEKRTMEMARQSLERHLAGSGAQLAQPVVGVFGDATTWALRFPGARVMPAERLVEWLASAHRGAADERVVARLLPLVVAR